MNANCLWLCSVKLKFLINRISFAGVERRLAASVVVGVYKSNKRSRGGHKSLFGAPTHVANATICLRAWPQKSCLSH